MTWAFGAALAQISPGPLHRAHARLEGMRNCTACHAAGKRIAPEKCLSCHTLIRSEMDAGTGLHAKGTHDRCETCHIEHHGRDFDLIYWKGGQKAFNHSGTGFPLKGGHERLACRACHRPEFIQDGQKLLKGGGSPGRTFLGLKRDCAACHEDPHKGQFGRPCGECHDETSWKPASRFSHDSTRFILTGRHRDLACGKCHASSMNPSSKKYPEYLKFAGTRFGTCADCHADPHEGRFGIDCESCHVTAGWDRVNPGAFRHQMTRFPLAGRHARLKCGQCHAEGKPLKIERFEHCSDCHADVHGGRFSKRPEYGDCSACHSVEGFSPARYTVLQHAGTRFPLSGAHLAIPCIACHTEASKPGGRAAPRFDFPDIRCRACHADPHQGQLNHWIQSGGCEICHTTEAWGNVRFDHDRTRFRLQGRHEAANCRACHLDSASAGARAILRFKGKSMVCATCHHDPHMGQFSEKTGGTPGPAGCERCHFPSSWAAEKFDHDRDSSFPLTGAHRSLACGKCHLPEIKNGSSFIRFKPVPHRCDSCHGMKIPAKENGTR
jgi:hypothetical protein